MKILGAVKTSVYIYMVPVITVVTSILVLQEKVTGIAIFGIALTLVGLFLSEKKSLLKRKAEPEGVRALLKEAAKTAGNSNE